MKCNRCFNDLSDGDVICSTCGRFIDNVSRVPLQGMKNLRAQVVDVVVRQAMINPQWRELCDLAMQVNRITISEVRTEIRRRGGEMHAPTAALKPKTAPQARATTPNGTPACDRLYQMRNTLETANKSNAEVSSLRNELSKIATDLDAALQHLNAELTDCGFRHLTTGIEFRRAANQLLWA
ncbi:MAG TPA: hypothetical protein V6C81_22405 [Planktothrix sp.]|jgi:hypothetical protein